MRGFSGAGRPGIGGRTRRFDRARAAKAAAGLALYLLAGALACAQDVSQPLDAPARLAFDMASAQANVAGLAILSLMLLATITAVLHLIGRRIWTRRVRELETELARTNAKLDRASLMLRSESQILISWERPDAEPTIEGDFALIADSPLPSRVLGFGAWLEPAEAARIEEATGRLLTRGEAFAAAVVSLRGRHLELDGRPVSGSAVMRIRDVSGERLQLAKLRDQFAQAEGALDGLAPRARSRRHAGVDARRRRRGSSGAIFPTPAPSTRPTTRRRSTRAANCSIRPCVARRRRRSGRPAPGAAARRRSSAASAGPSTLSRRARRSDPPASPATFPKSPRCGRRWSATRTTIRA